MIEINNVKINYIQYGNKNGKNIILLHGWGQNINMMKPLGDGLKKFFNIIIIDLPGYGESSEPTYPWDIYDYVKMIKEFCDISKIENPILIGHSFGGKISLLYASMYAVHKLVVLASPFKQEIEKMSIKVKTLKFLKKVPLINKLENFAKKHIGSKDYREATEMMRKVLVNTINLDITEDLKKINCPTLAIWGTLDEAVSIERAYELEKTIKNCGIVIYEGCSHYAYLERLNQTIKVVKKFLEEDMEE